MTYSKVEFKIAASAATVASVTGAFRQLVCGPLRFLLSSGGVPLSLRRHGGETGARALGGFGFLLGRATRALPHQSAMPTGLLHGERPLRYDRRENMLAPYLGLHKEEKRCRVERRIRAPEGLPGTSEAETASAASTSF